MSQLLQGKTFDIERDIKILMLTRVILVSILLGLFIVVQVRTIKELGTGITLDQKFQYGIIIFVYILSILWAFLFKVVIDKKRFAYLQLAVDVLIITAIVFSTGGAESMFSLLYFLIIIAASITLGKRGGIIIASLCSVLYGILIDLQYYAIIRPLGVVGFSFIGYSQLAFLYRILVHISAFYLVAMLTGMLSQRLRSSIVYIKELEKFTNDIIDNASLGIIILNSQKQILSINKMASSLVGKNLNEIFLQDIESLFPGINIRNKHKGQPNARYLYHHDKHVFEILVSDISFGPVDGRVSVIFFHDVTDLKRIEEEMKKVERLALIGELSARIAHEIKNPLSAISTCVQMLREKSSQSSMEERLFRIIFRELVRLEGLVSDFLYFARPKRIVAKRVDLENLVSSVVAMVKSSKENAREIEFQIFKEGSLLIHSDPDQLTQIFWNLLVNAVEAIPRAGVIRVNMSNPFGENGDVVTVRIEDTGPGFSDEALENLFRPFFTTKPRGSGLGLAIVKNTVESLGGSLKIENIPDGGARVTVTLPKKGNYDEG